MKLIISLMVLTSVLTAKPEVTAGLPAVAYLAKEIGGEALKVTTLVSSKQDPHDFAATPALLQELKGSQLFLSCNLHFEEVIYERLKESFKSLKFVDLSKTVPREQLKRDSHIWLSVANLTKMATVINAELCKTFPEHSAVYKKNYAELLMLLTQTHQDFSKKLANHKGATFFVHHPAFGYFAQDYGLQQYAIENEGKNPSPKQLLRLIKLAKEAKVQLILLQPQFNQKPAKMLADRINGAVFIANPMDTNPIDLLTKVTNAIVKYYPERSAKEGSLLVKPASANKCTGKSCCE
ncbi:MAG: zinc ABC transporter substrate-binding protein [Lentisphaeria bacterium]|nr:zinc ABC transporter substrate-binding protein [Lentisphaeria bacterium]